MDAAAEAVKLGNPKVMNIIMLGATTKLMDLMGVDWSGIIRQNVKPAFVDVNIRALQRGQDLV